MHDEPTAVMLCKSPDERLVTITFFGPTLPEKGSTTTYLRDEVIEWVERWLGVTKQKPADKFFAPRSKSITTPTTTLGQDANRK